MSALHRMITAYTAMMTLLNTALLMVVAGMVESFELVGQVALVTMVLFVVYPASIALDVAYARGYFERFGFGGDA